MTHRPFPQCRPLARRIASTALLATAALLPNAPCLAAADAAATPGATVVPVPNSVSAEAQAFYRSLQPRPGGTIDYSDTAAMTRLRNGLGQMFLGIARRITTDYRLEAVTANGVPAFWVRTGAPRHKNKVILFLHGGGYILGSAQTSIGLPLRIGPASSTPVLSVEYRLAPENPFPADLDDAMNTYRWLLKNGYRGSDIAVLGDSSGGGLALALALAARDAKLPMPAALAVLSPLTDLTGTGDTRQSLVGQDPLSSGGGSPHYALYAGGHDLHEPLISPVYADLRGLPPLLIQVGTRELLLSDAVRLARRAREAGVDVTLDVWDGMWHVFQETPDVPESSQAATEVGKFIERHLVAKAKSP